MTATTNIKEKIDLECDYLIVGAGATTLAFLDTLVTELPDAKIILIDKKAAPGGHWIDSYDYVQLHQPSLVYGIASKQLEGNWLKCMLTQFMLPWNHRANKTEILTYFADFVKENKEQIDFYSNSVYDFETSDEDVHFFSSMDGSVSYQVKVNVKLIDGSSNENIVPHNSPLQFPVDDEVRVMTPNQVYDAHKENSKEMRKNKYVVLGAGKTGMDAVVYLQRTMKIDPVDIAWVISQDVWMSSLNGGGSPKSHSILLLKYDNDTQKAALEGEEMNSMVRLDKNVMPNVFKFPLVSNEELKLYRNVKTIIRRGRATAIRRRSSNANDNSKDDGVVVEFGSDDHSPWEAFAPIDKCVFVHATSPGPFVSSYTKYQPDHQEKDTSNGIFDSEKKMTLNLLFEPPISISVSCLAKIEASRNKGTLDLECMKRLMLARDKEKGKPSIDGDNYTENEMLDALLQPYDLVAARPILNLAVILSICDKDPLVSMKWMKQNRLAFLGSVPGFKCMVCKTVQKLITKGDDGQKKVGLTEQDVRMLEPLKEQIQPLEGM
ncbi:hypothetical protein FRACYDRAFT_261011 [Fragilariopsis cylindrus CCMP1102]|uniref:FAD/NAD(P)-binding domain-containing protein n=1 Tax=Fragilariopsis cylindrus CCMP1102 TaxID=635003 RepID=A0A1E7FI66_9STRA|nr:hypothetical protein FRACYDRAFT_261011 [Fragilariopsis cylindrus CCMP1102]|eukprot:OEU17837.1 hypothetical protein FRACYDRAFT_261011 [Fragilariopsis cylindrus CCMP1102]